MFRYKLTCLKKKCYTMHLIYRKFENIGFLLQILTFVKYAKD